MLTPKRKLHPQEIKPILNLLIEQAQTVDPSLAKRLTQIKQWIKDLKPGSLQSKRFVLFFLQELIDYAENWLYLQSLTSEEQQKSYQALTPTERYWYGHLFPQWLNKTDHNFIKWRKELMSGEFNQSDHILLTAIFREIVQRGGSVWHSYIADLSMATDMLVSNQLEKPLCVQITSLSQEYSQGKSNDWENMLKYWQIERGLFLSYNPSVENLVVQIVNIVLYNSDRLETSNYLRFSL